MSTTHELVPTSEGDVELVIKADEESKDDKVVVSSAGYEPIVVDSAPAVLAFKNLTVTTASMKPENCAMLINNLTGTITGGFWAIMGSSGSGKTTFLSSLACRIDAFRMNVTGEITLNGKPYSKHVLKSMSGYVMQDDLVHATLTVGEVLDYTAQLRMHGKSTAEERKDREQQVMALMGITYCKNVLVGDTRKKGISGGERKRLCIAMELITKPSLLFLDEPTSGLDSATAFSVTQILKDLANRGECTIITTIHQPQTKIFALFDNLILMRRGGIVYQGASNKVIEYFDKLGFPCPPHTNPADHIIDVLSENEVDEHLSEEEKIVKKESLRQIDARKFSVPYDPDFGGTKATFSYKEWQPWYKQFLILFKRNIHFHVRRYDIIATNIFVTLLIATFVSFSTWRGLTLTRNSQGKRLALLFFCVIHQGIVASLQGTHSFPLERAIMLRERQSGSYYVSAYFLSKTCADIAAQVIAPIIYTCLVYPCTGLQNTANKFFIFLCFMILTAFSATSLANMISCVCVSIEMSTVILALSYEWVRLFGGWFISPLQLTQYGAWRFADTLSYLKYAFVGISLNEDHGLVFHCQKSELSYVAGTSPLPASTNTKIYTGFLTPLSPTCVFKDPSVCTVCTYPPLTTIPGQTTIAIGLNTRYTGEEMNEYYGYNQFTIGQCAGYLVAYIVCCRFVGYLGLRFVKL